MQFTRWRLTLTLALLLCVGLPAAPPAAAMVILGGGAPIVVDGNNYCTLTTIGRDRAGDMVGFTGACGGPGSTVTVAGSDVPVGTVVAVNGDLKYAVIKFEVPDLLPVSDYAGTVVNGIGPDPQFNALVCKYGPVNPGGCGSIKLPELPLMMMMGAQFEAGDVGAPVTMDGLLVGLAYNGGLFRISKWEPLRPVTYLTKFSAILADVNASDGPASGFVPIGS